MARKCCVYQIMISSEKTIECVYFSSVMKHCDRNWAEQFQMWLNSKKYNCVYYYIIRILKDLLIRLYINSMFVSQ